MRDSKRDISSASEPTVFQKIASKGNMNNWGNQGDISRSKGHIRMPFDNILTAKLNKPIS
jgi:hypothetical protein